MPVNPAQYPMINGNRYEWASAEISLAGIIYEGFKTLNYKHSLKPGELYGNHVAMVGRTKGQYKVDSCTGEMWKADYQRVIQAVRTLNPSVGYMEVAFPIMVAYSESLGDGVTVDQLLGARIMSDENGGTEGTDPLIVKMEFHVMRLLPGGIPAVIAKSFSSLQA